MTNADDALAAAEAAEAEAAEAEAAAVAARARARAIRLRQEADAAAKTEAGSAASAATIATGTDGADREKDAADSQDQAEGSGEIEPGGEFADFKIIRLLGSGGQGDVYLATHPRLPREDALKILPKGLTGDDEFRARFNREADIAAGLFHQHIVGVHDRGEHEGRLWISMDYVDGLDAGTLLAEDFPTGMPVDAVLEITDAIAEALDFAHGRKLLHRDVKPANILLTGPDREHRRILLADFGIARQLEDVGGITNTNVAVGTVRYAAPEQLSGEQIDGRADQYALAVSVFELLIGEPMFDDVNTAVLIAKHLNADPPLLAARNGDLASLDEAMQKALAKDSSARFESCTAFAKAIRDAVPEIGGTRLASLDQAPTLIASAEASSERAKRKKEAEPTGATAEAQISDAKTSREPSESRPKRPRRAPSATFLKVAATIVTVLATVGLIALSAAMYINHKNIETQQRKSAEFAAAARQGVVTLMSLDHTRAQQDVDAIVAVTTGDFKKDFESQAADMVKVAQENKVVTQVTVNSVAVQQMTDDTATVLLAAMSTVSNAASQKQEPRAWRLSVDVARDGDQIKLAKVEFVP